MLLPFPSPALKTSTEGMAGLEDKGLIADAAQGAGLLQEEQRPDAWSPPRLVCTRFRTWGGGSRAGCDSAQLGP